MKCHACGSKYCEIETNNKLTYQCVNCFHIYRPYDNALKFHMDGKFRTQKRNQKDNREFDSNGNITQYFHDARKIICNKRLLTIDNYISNSDNCLDIGAGAGTFAKRLLTSDKSVKIECTEVDSKLRKECERLGFKTHKTIPLNQTFNIAFAWHVLEHVEDVHDFIKKVSHILDENGTFIVEVPSNRRIPKVFDGHLHYFGEKSFKTLLKQYFENVELMEGVQNPALLAICTRKV